MNKLLKLKARYYLIMFFVMLVIDVLLCFFAFYHKNTTLNIVLLVIAFLLTGLFFDVFMNKIFTNKTNNKLFKKKEYKFKGMDNLYSNVSNYTQRKISYGTIFSKVNGDCLYKITIVDNIKDYHEYDPDKEKNNTKTPGVDKAKTMVGIEIFVDKDEELLNSIVNFSISNSKMKYCAYYLDNEKIIDSNYLESEENLSKQFEDLLNVAGIYEEDTNL